MQAGMHKPRFKLFHLVALVGLLAVPMAILPTPASLLAAGLILVGSILWSVTDRFTLIEWAVLVAIGYVLTMLTMPAVSTNCYKSKAPPAPTIKTTNPPVPSTLQAP
jgi:hypothetical protein